MGSAILLRLLFYLFYFHRLCNSLFTTFSTGTKFEPNAVSSNRNGRKVGLGGVLDTHIYI